MAFKALTHFFSSINVRPLNPKPMKVDIIPIGKRIKTASLVQPVFIMKIEDTTNDVTMIHNNRKVVIANPTNFPGFRQFNLS